MQFPHSGHLGLTRYRRARRFAQKILTSRVKHWFVLTLVVLDVAGILTDIFIALITCELNREGESWVAPTRNALTLFSLVLSSLFLVELTLELWAHGPR